MTLGWVEITVDGKPAMVRICYIRAWDDPDWRRVNGLSSRNPSHGGRRPRLGPPKPKGM